MWFILSARKFFLVSLRFNNRLDQVDTRITNDYLIYWLKSIFFLLAAYNVKSSLILQMALYFNVTFFPIWLIVVVCSFISQVIANSKHLYHIAHHHWLCKSSRTLQYACLGWFGYLIYCGDLFALIVVEVSRLYLGVSGNLSEQAAELSTFFFATLILQCPLIIITALIAVSLRQLLFTVVLTLSAAMMVVQLSVSFQVLRNVSRYQPFWK